MLSRSRRPGTLPDELILQIFKESDPTPLALGVYGCVNRQWHQVSATDELWRPWTFVPAPGPGTLRDAFLVRTDQRPAFGNCILAQAYTDPVPLGFDVDDHHLGTNRAHPFLLRDNAGRDNDVDAAIVAHHPHHFVHASPAVRNHLDVVRRTVRAWPDAALFVGAGVFKEDRDFAHRCLSQLHHGASLRFFSSLPSRYRYQADFARTALRTSLQNVQYIGPTLQTDTAFLIDVIRCAPRLYNPPTTLLYNAALMPVLAERGFWHLLPNPDRLAPNVLDSALATLKSPEDVCAFAETFKDARDVDRAQGLYALLQQPERRYLLPFVHVSAERFFSQYGHLISVTWPPFSPYRRTRMFAGLMV